MSKIPPGTPPGVSLFKEISCLGCLGIALRADTSTGVIGTWKNELIQDKSFPGKPSG